MLWALGIVLAVMPDISNAQVSSTLNVHLTLANDYRSYGLSQIASGNAYQAGIDFQHHTGFFAGLETNNVDYAADRFRDSQRDRQLDAYAGYSWNPSRWLVNAALRRYSYPDSTIEYDYSEAALSAVFRDRVFMSVSYTDNLLARWSNGVAYEAGLAWPLPQGIELSASVGRFRADDFIEPRFTHWNVGISKVYKRFSLDLRHHDDSVSRTTPLGNANGPRWVLSASYAWEKRI